MPKKNKFSNFCILSLRFIKCRIAILLFLLMLQMLVCRGQTDSSFLKNFPYAIGNLAFAVDSLETNVGKIMHGTDTSFQIGIYNAGDNIIKLYSGKSNKFVDITYSVADISPKHSAVATINLHALSKMPTGQMEFEAVFKTDDKKNPYKFLYFNSYIIKNTITSETMYDTIPHLVFDNYLYDFGHLRRGKNLYYTFSFSNKGNKNLIIKQIIVDKGIRVLNLTAKLIPPGAYGSFTIKIKGRHYVGVLHKSINVYSNDPVNPLLTLGIHGTIQKIFSKKNQTSYCNGY